MVCALSAEYECEYSIIRPFISTNCELLHVYSRKDYQIVDD